MFTLIKNAHIVSPDLEIACGSLLVENNKIAAVSANEITAPAGAKVIDAAGKMVLPGFIDQHIHGSATADAMDGTLDALETIANSIACEGTTAYLATTMTQSHDNIMKAMVAVNDYKKLNKTIALKQNRLKTQTTQHMLKLLTQILTRLHLTLFLPSNLLDM